MKKDTNNLIFEESKEFFQLKKYKLKKNPQSGVIFSKYDNGIRIEGCFGFYDDVYPRINYIGAILLNIKFMDLEDIYEKLYTINKCILTNNLITLSYGDIEWRDIYSHNYINSEDKEVVTSHTKRILNRIETHILPLIEKYKSVQHLADLYKKDPVLFKQLITDNENLKYLLILKLAKSELFDIEFEKKDNFLKNWFKENPDYKEKDAFYNVFQAIKTVE